MERKTFTINMKPELYNHLKEVSKEFGIPMASYMKMQLNKNRMEMENKKQ